jgi:hypothetical protein
MDSVGSNFPAKDEILIVDKDTKSIIAPIGYNNVICNYGESDITEVYFLISRYLGKNNEIDIMNDDVSVSIYAVLNGAQGICTSAIGKTVTKQLYTEQLEDRESEGLVLIKWKLPVGMTSGNLGPGTFSIMIGVMYYIGNDLMRWYSNTYSKLTIGESLFQLTPEEGQEWDITTDMIESVIANYLNNINFTINANE